MPYRRLPNTDLARLRTLRTAVQRAADSPFSEQVLTYKSLNEAQRFLLTFEGQLSQYSEDRESKVMANQKYRHIVANARMYISHFIQVLNLAAIRGDIKREQMLLYKLDPDVHSLPDLSTEKDLLEWGQNIIEGEQQRQSQGGFPIYNPTIAKVKVHYDIFKENQVNQKVHKKKTKMLTADMGEYRAQADAIIVDIWNQVEEHYKDLLPYARMCACKEYGVIYYYRPHEKRLSKATDDAIQKAIDASPTFDFGL